MRLPTREEVEKALIIATALRQEPEYIEEPVEELTVEIDLPFKVSRTFIMNGERWDH